MLTHPGLWAVLSLFLASCANDAPRLRLNLPKDYGPDDMIWGAEIIVIGTVQSQKLVGPVVQGYRLVRVTIVMEETSLPPNR